MEEKDHPEDPPKPPTLFPLAHGGMWVSPNPTTDTSPWGILGPDASDEQGCRWLTSLGISTASSFKRDLLARGGTTQCFFLGPQNATTPWSMLGPDSTSPPRGKAVIG